MKTLAILSLLFGTSALAQPAKTMFAIHYRGATLQPVDDSGAPKGKAVALTAKPSGMQTCRLTAPGKGVQSVWFRSFIDADGRIAMTHEYSDPKDRAACAVNLVSNLGVKLGSGSGEYKFVVRVSFTPQ